VFRRFAVVSLVMGLQGCLFVTSVNQPSSGTVGQAFVSKVVATTTNTCTACVPLFAIRLPIGWVIDTCSYSGDFTGTCTRSSQNDVDFENAYGTTNLNYSWRAYAGSATDFTAVGNQTEITWQIVPEGVGTSVLDYAAGAESTNGDVDIPEDQQAGFEHDIDVQQARLVPTMSPFGLALLAGLLVILVRIIRPGLSNGVHRNPA
jgi:uncharacterized protein YceK